MGFFKKLFGIKEQEEIEEEQRINNDPNILRDHNGNELICPFCKNQDNETKKRYPMIKGEKIKFNGKACHIRCVRAFKKYAKNNL